MKTILCLFSLLLMSTQAQAETRLGAFGGVNLATLSVEGSSANSITDRTGLMEGLFLQHGLNDTLYLETGLRYIQKGGLDNGTRINLGYLNVPVYVKYKVPTGGSIRPMIFAGPTAGVKVGAKVGTVIQQRARQQFTAFDFTADVGVGAEWTASEVINIGLSGVYSFGLVNVADGPREIALAGRSLKNENINIFASVTWKL